MEDLNEQKGLLAWFARNPAKKDVTKNSGILSKKLGDDICEVPSVETETHT